METNPRLEPLGRFDRYPPEAPAESWHRSGRARLFILVFGLVLVIGLIYTLLQPAVYRSSATVLMSAPSAIDAEVSAADIQSVAIQRKILLGEDITGRLVAELADTEGIRRDASDMRGLLQVDPVPDTNLVEMYAQGSDDELLPLLVNNWIDVYLAIRGEDIEQRKQQTLQIVQDELDGLAGKLTEAREALEQYRQEHEIISMERQENEVLARLDGLNKALNNAIEEEAKTRAYLDTLRQAITRGAQVVPPGERRGVEELDKELRELQAQYLELTKRYTPEYIEKEPQLRAIPVRIGELKAALARALSQGKDAELANATQAHAAARQTVVALQRQLDEHKQRVSEFNTIYATHEALVEDLAGLEQLNRDTQARQIQVEVRQVEKYPQVSVIERPGAESERIGPDYFLLLGGTLGAALGLGVFSVWLMGFLSPKPAQPAYVTLTGVHMYPQDGGQLGYTNQPDPRLAQDSTARLEGHGDGDEGDEPAR
jgi:polysaccharide biosynthesis transport protein